jgi:hypothetical protein
MPLPRSIHRIAFGAALVLLAACSDRTVLPTAPPEPPALTLGQLACTVQVRAQTVSCAEVAPATPSGVHGDRIIGGQDVYVKLASSGTSYDPEGEVLQSYVTVENLAARALGTPDGVSTSGVRVFFAEGPTVTEGEGAVTLNNADGSDAFLGSNQPFFLYNEILEPYQVSAQKAWRFNVPSTVGTFVFTLYVAAALPNEGAPLLDKVWTGAASTDWTDAGNWRDGVVPDSTSTVSVPPDALLASHVYPVLSGDVVVLHLRVGGGSTLALNSHALRVRGNIDALGNIVGAPTVSGSDVLLRGTVQGLQVSGSASLEGAVTSNAAVGVTGSLTVKDQSLSISIP